MKFIYFHNTPLGLLTLASDGENLTGIWFEAQKYYPSNLTGVSEGKNLPVFLQTIEWLDIYFNGKNPPFMPPIRFSGTPFRTMVWTRLIQIPYGETATYGQIAKEIAEKMGIAHMSAQAVGGAIGHNPISILVPCHRVVGANRKLTGYAGGLERKKTLLALEDKGLPLQTVLHLL